jgi:hypothetical protein
VSISRFGSAWCWLWSQCTLIVDIPDIDCVSLRPCSRIGDRIAGRPYPRDKRYHPRKSLTIALVVGVVTVIGSVIIGLVTGFTAAVLGFFAFVVSIVRLVFSSAVKIILFPLGMCILQRQPPSPLGNLPVL